MNSGHLIEESEWDDFLKCVESVGLKRDDFEYVASQPLPIRPSGGPLIQEVQVKRKSTGDVVTFTAGQGRSFAGEACRALERRQFGPLG